MRRRYLLLDVFTRSRFAGNPLAVFPEADGIEPEAMQRIAAELNLSETAFVQSPDRPGGAARVRIFTPASELPFAGHPTVGTAAALLPADVAAGDMVLAEQVGDVSVAVRRDGEIVFAEFTVPKLPQPVGPAMAPETVARVVGLAPGQVAEATVWSAGVPFLILRLADRQALDAARLDGGAWSAELAETDARHLYLTAPDDGSATPPDQPDAPVVWHARMFAPAMGIAEDPATGAAACALAGRLAADLPDGRHRAMIHQGAAMGRPSVLELGIDAQGGVAAGVTLGGWSVTVGEGMLETETD